METTMENVLAHTHTILVHFALGLFITGVVVDGIGWLIDHDPTRYAGGIMIILGGITGLATMATGEYAEENVESILPTQAKESLEYHEEWGGWAGYILFVTALVRLSLFRYTSRILSMAYLGLAVISVVVLVVTAQYGGKVTHAGHPHLSVTGNQPIEQGMDSFQDEKRDD